MQEELQSLIDKANSIVQKTGHGTGVRYPKKLKEIISSLANDYGLSTQEIIKLIPISHYSAREWPKSSKNQFKKIIIAQKNRPSPRKKGTVKGHTVELQFIFLSLQSLLLALQIFLR